jgi:hypothetical protein
VSKEVQMTFRVEPELRAEFTHAALEEHRPAAQVLRELMRAYIQEARQRVKARPANDSISAAERRRREKAVNFARASVGLEGFKPSEADEELSRRYVAGDITISDAIQAVHDSIRER